MRVAEGRERPEGARGRSQRGDSEVERPVKRPVPGWIHPKYVGYASCTPLFELSPTILLKLKADLFSPWG